MPGGFIINIKYVSNAKINAMKKKDPTLKNEDLLGFWDGSKIVINSSEPKWVQVKTLAHEMLHAVADWQNWLEQNIVDLIQAEAGETALEDLVHDEEE